MSKLLLYAVFHANLNYSYIPEDLYPQILRRCYWPLLRIIDNLNVPVGLEFSGHTLQVVNRLDRSFVAELIRLRRRGTCEVIGSGYAQAIMPLIPSPVNRRNLSLGNSVYEEILGRRPEVAYVNEQVYSAGLPRLYRDAGYKALMVNWESALPVHAENELRYRPCAVPVGEGANMPVIWHSLAAYRDFQQYVENEIPLDAYLGRLLSHLPDTGERAYPLYSSDWEVFDFKPWRVQPEGFRQLELGEMERLAGLLKLLKHREDIEFVGPSSLFSRFPGQPVVHPESSAFPLPYKKQGQHNVSRWAVGGRDGVRLNTQCHQLYQELLLADWYLQQDSQASQREECGDLWRELCLLWGSDYRTFTTEEKYLEFRNRMGAALARAAMLRDGLQPGGAASGRVLVTNRTSVPADSEPASFTFFADGASPGGLPAYELHLNGRTEPCQVTEQGAEVRDGRRLTVEATPAIGAAQSGVATLRRPAATSRRPNPACHIDESRHIVETPAVRLCLRPEWGGAIESLGFPQVAVEPLISQPVSGSHTPALETEALRLGDLTLEDRVGRKVTDHQEVELEYPDLGQPQEIFVPVRCHIPTELGSVWKTYRVYVNQPRVDLTVRFQWRDLVPKWFRVGRVALNPGAFDRNTLHYVTVNGGEDIERFALAGQQGLRDEPQGPNGSASVCLGATEGWVVLGDTAKGIGLVTRPATLYSVPILRYNKTDQDPGGFVLTLAHSLSEPDDTNHTLWRGHSTWRLSILAGGEDIVTRTRTSALLSNGGLTVRSGGEEGPARP